MGKLMCCGFSAALSTVISSLAFGQESMTDTLASSDSGINQVAGKQSQSLGGYPVEEEGFLDGSHLDILGRFYYRALTDSSPKLVYARRGEDGNPDYYTKSSASLGTLGTTINFRSGFTPGTVGFGIDISAMNGTTLVGDQDTASLTADMANADNLGRPNRNWAKIAVADLKLKRAGTELKLGRQIIDSPLLHSNYNRTFPASFVGASLLSSDFENFTLKAGSVTKVIGRNSTNEEALSLSYAPTVKLDRASYASIEYSNQSGVSGTIATTLLEDALCQYLIEVKKDFQFIGGFQLTPQVAFYHGLGVGRKLAGDDSVSMAVAGVTSEWGGSALTLKYQQVFGDTFYDYLMETNSIYYSNTMYSDYQAPREKSIQALYKYDFGGNGLPGLVLYAWALAGWDIDGSHYKGDTYANLLRGVENARHHEVGVSPSYTLQSGRLKGASIRLGYVAHRQTGGQIAGDANEFLLVTELPLKIF